jgi:molecular chaperone HscC
MNRTIKNSHVVGVDLGTTNTVLAFFDDTGKSRVIPNVDGEMLTPSIVHVGPGGKEILVGTAAKHMMLLEPKRTFKEVKRDVATDKIYLKEDGLEITPESCQAEILRFMRQSAIKYFGDERAASRMVVTVPADFGEKARQSVVRSINQAGAECIQLINEPTAAGLAYGLSDKQGDRLVLVTDFGGGTFDASLIAYAGGQATVLASQGDKALGGKNVDDILLRLVCDAFKKEHSLEVTPNSHPAEYLRLWEEVIRQKHMLASRTEVKIVARVESKQVIVPITRPLLAELNKSLMERIDKIVQSTIQNAKAEISEISHVLFIGGSTRLVPFQALMTGIFGKERLFGGSVSPDWAVAEGAVIHAVKVEAAQGKTVVNEALQSIPAPAIDHVDVTAHSLGVAVQDRVSSARYCSVLLERNTPIPCQISKQYASLADDQTRFKVTVLQGESDQRLEDCLIVGERELHFPARKHTEPSFEVTMAYNPSGMVQVAVKDLVSQKIEDITVRFFGSQNSSKN